MLPSLTPGRPSHRAAIPLRLQFGSLALLPLHSVVSPTPLSWQTLFSLLHFLPGRTESPKLSFDLHILNKQTPLDGHKRLFSGAACELCKVLQDCGFCRLSPLWCWGWFCALCIQMLISVPKERRRERERIQGESRGREERRGGRETRSIHHEVVMREQP